VAKKPFLLTAMDSKGTNPNLTGSPTKDTNIQLNDQGAEETSNNLSQPKVDFEDAAERNNTQRGLSHGAHHGFKRIKTENLPSPRLYSPNTPVSYQETFRVPSRSLKKLMKWSVNSMSTLLQDEPEAWEDPLPPDAVGIIDPRTSLRAKFAVKLLRCLSIIMYSICVPFSVVFRTNDRRMFVLVLAIQVLWVLDVAYNASLAHFNRSGELVTSRWGIVRDFYCRDWLVVDIISATPVVLMFVDREDDYLLLLGMFKVLRLLRDVVHSTGKEALVYYLLSYCAMVHWAACLWCGVCAASSNDEVGWATKEHLYTDGPLVSEITDRWTLHLHSLHTAGLLMVGEDVGPQTNVEKLVASCVLLSGIMLTALILGGVVNSVEALTASELQHKRNLGQLENVLRRQPLLDPEAEKQVRAVFNHQWQARGTDDVNKDRNFVLKNLSFQVKQSVLALWYQDLLGTCVWFKPLENEKQPAHFQEFTNRIFEVLSHQLFFKGEWLLWAGRQDKDIYFIKTGAVWTMSGALPQQARTAERKCLQNWRTVSS
jgi:hypothetical protein